MNWREQCPRRRRPPKRIRRKLHLREFTQFGFECSFSLTIDGHVDGGGPRRVFADPVEGKLDLVFDRFLEEAIEANSLSCGGGMLSCFVTHECLHGWRHLGHCVQTSATEEQRQKVIAWFRAQPEVTKFEVSLLMDANYGGWGGGEEKYLRWRSQFEDRALMGPSHAAAEAINEGVAAKE